jgi:hypothetical protein
MTRDQYDVMMAAGECPDCGVNTRKDSHSPNCRKAWFDRGYERGYHDGANNLPDPHDTAFLMWLLESGEIESPDEEW